ncbi:MAG: hypothetical protein ACI4JC_09120 [Faecalibacterium sp.]
MNEKNCFSAKTLMLGILTATLAGSFVQTGAESSARAVLVFGLPCAAALALLSGVAAQLERAGQLFSGTGVFSKLVCGGFALWFAAELFQTVRQAQQVCWEQFGSMAVLGLAPLLVWLGWQMDGTTLDHTARVLWWLAALGAVVCVIGLSSQMRWQRLFEQTRPLWEEDLPHLALYAEYFALPLLCDSKTGHSCAWLPLGGFAVQGLFALGMQLLFGPLQGSDYTGYELLRAWALGAFSRLDALIVLIWLTTALYRICFLSSVLHILAQRLGVCPAAKTPKKEGTA